MTLPRVALATLLATTLGLTSPAWAGNDKAEDEAFAQANTLRQSVTNEHARGIMASIVEKFGMQLVVDEAVEGMFAMDLRGFTSGEAVQLFEKVKNLRVRKEGQVLRVHLKSP